MKLRELADKMGIGPRDIESISDALGVDAPPDDIELEPHDAAAIMKLLEERNAVEPGPVSAVDLIDSLGDTMNEMGVVPDDVDPAGVGDAPGDGPDPIGVAEAGQHIEPDADDENVEPDAKITPAIPTESPKSGFVGPVTFLRRRAHARRIAEAGDLTDSIDENWKPPWMLVMIIAAICLGLGTMVIIKATEGDSGTDETAAALGVPAPAVGTCYSTDNLGTAGVSSCSTPHTHQVVATYLLDASVDTSNELVLIDARLRCLDEFTLASNKPMPPDSEMRARIPSSFDVAQGSRAVVCEVHALGNTTLFGSLL